MGEHVERGPRVSTARAAEVPEVPEVDRGIAVWRPAAHAEARVRGVLHRVERHGLIVEPVADRAAAAVSEVCGNRIVEKEGKCDPSGDLCPDEFCQNCKGDLQCKICKPGYAFNGQNLLLIHPNRPL